MYRELLEKMVTEQNIEDLKILNEILEQFKKVMCMIFLN